MGEGSQGLCKHVIYMHVQCVHFIVSAQVLNCIEGLHLLTAAVFMVMINWRLYNCVQHICTK